MPQKARGGVFGFLVHTTDVANDLLQSNYVRATITGKMDPFQSAAPVQLSFCFWSPQAQGSVVALLVG